MQSWRGSRGAAGLVVLLALVSACGGSGSESGSGSGSGSGDGAESGAPEQPEQEITVMRRGADGFSGGFDVAAGEDTGWLLVGGEPAEVWAIGGDGTLTRRAELADGGDEIAVFGDGAAVTRFRCTDPTDDECGAPVADLLLLGPDGAVDHELTLAESDAGSMQAVGMRIVGASDDQVWVETTITGIELFAVSRAGDVEPVPAAHRRQFANDQTCVVDGELLTVRVHTDLYDPEQGPPDSGVTMSAETPIRTTVGLEAFADGEGEGEWQPVDGSERTFDLRGDEARAVCDGASVRVEGADLGGGSKDLARWTGTDGWVEAPTVTEAPPPPGSVSVDGCPECLWGSDGEILRRGDDGTFQATGLVLADPDGADDAPESTEVDLGPDGAMAACASFPDDGAETTTAPTAPPSTVTVTPALAAPRPPASQEDGRPLVCDIAPT